MRKSSIILIALIIGFFSYNFSYIPVNSIIYDTFKPTDDLPLAVRLISINWTTKAGEENTEFNFFTDIEIENLLDENLTVTFSDSGEFVIYITAEFQTPKYYLEGPNIGFLQVITNRTYTPGITLRSYIFPFSINSTELETLPIGTYYVRIGTSHPEFYSNPSKKLTIPAHGATIIVGEEITQINYEYLSTTPHNTPWMIFGFLEPLIVIGSVRLTKRKRSY